jgi:acylphosphatase
MTVKKRMLIKGKKVHNVGYRPFLMEKAQELKILNFHAKNVKEDGWQVVDVRVGGEEGRIDSFLKFARENSPEPAEVDNISVLEYEDDIMTLEEFSSVFSALQLSKIVQTGLGMIEMQKQTLEKQDETISELKAFRKESGEKQDETISELKAFRKESGEKQDENIVAIGEVSEKIDGGKEEIVTEIKGLREDLKTYMEDKFARIEQEIGVIKAKIGVV